MLAGEIVTQSGRTGHFRFGRLRADPEVFRLVQRVAMVRQVSLSAMVYSPRGRGRDAAARQLAMYLTHVLLGRSQEEVARLFDRDRTTVAHACQQLEDVLEVQGLDTDIARIERSYLRQKSKAEGRRHAA